MCWFLDGLQKAYLIIQLIIMVSSLGEKKKEKMVQVLFSLNKIHHSRMSIALIPNKLI